MQGNMGIGDLLVAQRNRSIGLEYQILMMALNAQLLDIDTRSVTDEVCTQIYLLIQSLHLRQYPSKVAGCDIG